MDCEERHLKALIRFVHLCHQIVHSRDQVQVLELEILRRKLKIVIDQRSQIAGLPELCLLEEVAETLSESHLGVDYTLVDCTQCFQLLDHFQ